MQENIFNLQNLFEGFVINTNFLTIALAGLIIMDFVSGIAKGYKVEKKIISSKLRDGGFKKAGIILVIILGYGLSELFSDAKHIIYNSVTAYYIYTELISVIENLDAIGVSLPPFIINLKGKGENK